MNSQAVIHGVETTACVEVEIVGGQPKVLSVCEAFECGTIQNPANVKAHRAGGSAGLNSVGAGETPVIAVAPAIANAMMNAGAERGSMPLLG